MTTDTTTDRAPMIAHDTELGRLVGALHTSRQRVDTIAARAAARRVDSAVQTSFTEALVAHARAVAAVADHEAAYTGWSRFFLVLGSGGHIHSSLHCSTCYPSTSFAALSELSGLGQAEAVETHGEILCSVCFPDAPVAWTSGVAKATIAERSARDDAKAERAAKRAAKALYADDAERVLRINDGRDRLGTIAAARLWLTDAAWWTAALADEGRRHVSFGAADETQVAEALAARTGETVADVLAAAAKRAAKR